MGKKWLVPISSVTLGKPERDNVNDALDSQWLSPGKYVQAYEKKFAETVGRKYALAFNSGTDALRCTWAALKEYYRWPDRSEVIVPATTFVATINVLLQVGLKPVFVDTGPDHNIDCEQIEPNENTVAICPVHMFGLPADLYTLRLFGLPIIEDSCESIGAGYIPGHPSYATLASRTLQVGQAGTVACFSTYACHILCTGIGGMAVLDFPPLYELIRSYLNHGRNFDHYDQFVFDRVGYSSRLSELEAAVGLAQLEILPQIVKKRQKAAARIAEGLAPLKSDLEWTDPHSLIKTHSWMYFPIVIKNPLISRDRFCAFLNEKDIETRPLMPLLDQPCYRHLNINPNDYPVAYRAQKQGFYVGCHQNLADTDIEYLVHMIHAALNHFVKVEA